MEKMIKYIGGGRKFGLDLVRTAAVVFVMAGHFFASWNTKFMEVGITDFSLFLQSIAQFVFKGVPLYLMLSGYLNYNKQLSKKYYKGAKRILTAYLFYSIVTILFRIYYLGEQGSIAKWINAVFAFEAIPYAWYIEMWIGLFLLIPFLNILWHKIEIQKHKVVLIGTLAFMTFFPVLTNRYGVHPLPGFWKGMYPLTFYYIGMYIRQYQPHVNKKLLTLIILGIGSINGVFNLLFGTPDNIIFIAGEASGVLGAICGVSLFLLMYDIECNHEKVTWVMYKVSRLSLDMYMCNFIFDSLVYPYFVSRYFVTQSQFGAYFFVIVPILFIGAFFMAWAKTILFSLPQLAHVLKNKMSFSC